MWDLIQENHYPVVFSCELLVGIFWEETMFTNRKQLQGPAVGFGSRACYDESRQCLLRHKLLSELDPDRRSHQCGDHERCIEHAQRQRIISRGCVECICGGERASSKQEKSATVAGLRAHSKKRRYR